MMPACRDILPVPVNALMDPLHASFSSTRSRRSAAAAIGHTDRWNRDVLSSISALFGAGDAAGFDRSSSQEIGVAHCRDVVAAMGPLRLARPRRLCVSCAEKTPDTWVAG